MKPRRDITLGEMQDECKTRIKCCTGCPYKEVCGEIPKLLDLTDPPRFTEAQMAFWKALYSVGVSKVFKAPSELKFSTKSTTLPTAGNMGSLRCEAWNWLGSEELLDLAELLGKDGEK